MKKFLFIFISILFVCKYTNSSQNITQPIGLFVQVWNDPKSVNNILMQWNHNITSETVPFDLNSNVTEVILTTPQHFVRMYAPGSGSKPNGLWITRAEYVRGKTPEQLKEDFALPAVPTHIVNVDLPISTPLWTGIVAPIKGYGKGGTVQYRILADSNGTNYFPHYQLINGKRDHPQEIGKYALSYQRMNLNGHARKIAAYLDQFIPKPYSDLENIYTFLDDLNWIEYGPKPLSHALKQLSPQCYEILSFLTWRNDLLFSNSVLEQNLQCPPQFKGFGELINAKKNPSISFKVYTGGGMASFNTQPLENFFLGIAIAGLQNNLLCNQHRNGKMDLTSAKLGVYANYSFSPHLLITTLITSGYSRSKVERPIVFSVVNRKAHSASSSYDMAAHIKAKIFLPFKQELIVPFTRLSYFFLRQNRFKEKGANSLSLYVGPFNSKILRTVYGLEFKNCTQIVSLKILPQVELAWAYDFALGHPKINARLKDLKNSFSIRNEGITGHHLLIGTGLTIQIHSNLSTTVRYDAEWNRYFTSHQAKIAINSYF